MNEEMIQSLKIIQQLAPQYSRELDDPDRGFLDLAPTMARRLLVNLLAQKIESRGHAIVMDAPTDEPRNARSAGVEDQHWAARDAAVVATVYLPIPPAIGQWLVVRPEKTPAGWTTRVVLVSAGPTIGFRVTS